MKKGKKSVVLWTIGAECQRYAVTLCITADGWKLPPYVVVQKKINKTFFPQESLFKPKERAGWSVSVCSTR